MRTNPFSDGLFFLTENYWRPRCSGPCSSSAWRSRRRHSYFCLKQRSVDRLVRYIVRGVVGLMWWQQSLWKGPPDFEGLRHWTEEMVKNAAFPIQARLIESIVLTHFVPFGYLIYSLEVVIGFSLIVGLFVRGVLDRRRLAIFNIYLGLYRSETEWPWTYAFLVLLMVIFAVERYGRSLGADALLTARKWRRVWLECLLT